MKLITLNIWGGQVHKPLLEFIKKYNNDVDIFCFQEVFKSDRNIFHNNIKTDIYSDIADILTDYDGYYAPMFEKHDTKEKVDFELFFGQATFVRKSIKVLSEGDVFIYGTYGQELTKSLKNDQFMDFPRNLHFVDVDRDNKETLIGNLHGFWIPESKEDTPERLGQSDKIIKFLDLYKHRKILCGDFNLNPNTKSMEMLEKNMVNLVSFFFKPDSPFLWTPGQFLISNLDHKNPDIRGKMRFFTISSAPFENHITITTKIDDKAPSSFKKTLNKMPIGGKIQAKGPDGNFVVEDVFAEHVFIAGGIGITPFISIIKQLNNDNAPMNITLLYSNKNDDISFRGELEKAKKTHPELKIHYFISPHRIDKEAIKKLIPDLKKPLYYISGPNAMVEDMLDILKNLGVKDKKIKSDYFDGYKAI